MSRLTLIVAMALVGAGCIGAPESPPLETAVLDPVAEQAGALVADPANASIDAPTWARGDAWHVEGDYGGEVARSTLVVTDAGSDYVLSTTSEDLASYDALFDISYLGKIRGSDLAGEQGGAPVRFFDFPLEDGKTWVTMWDEREVTLKAAFSPRIETFLGPQPGFVISGMRGDEPYVTYDFVPAIRWWSKVTWGDGGGMRISGAASNWTGSVVSGTGETLAVLAPAAPVTGTPHATFMVTEAHDRLALFAFGYGNAYVHGLLVIDPEHKTYPTGGSNVEISAEPGFHGRFEQMSPVPGEWRILGPAVHDPDGHYSATVTAISLETREFAP